MKRHLSLLFALFALFAAVAPAFAQSASVSLTEERINQSFRVTNPARVTVSNVIVDLQPNQVAISLTITPRRSNIAPFNGIIVLAPSLSEGRVTWNILSATANGTPASGETLAQLNSIAQSWMTYFRVQAQGTLSAISISDTAITYTLATSGTLNPTIVVGSGGTSISLSEADINNTLRIRGISNLTLDCQSNQVVITGNYSYRGTTYSIQAIFVPALAEGKVTWTLTSLTSNGGAVPAEISARVQTAITNAYQAFWNSRVGRVSVTAISVSEEAVLWTVQG